MEILEPFARSKTGERQRKKGAPIRCQNKARGCRPSRMSQWQDARYPVLLALAFLIVMGGMAWAAGRLFEFDWSADQVERQIEAWGSWAAVASVGLMVLHSFVPFPAEILAVANGMIFGPLWGTIVTWVGAMLGASLAFAVARLLGRPFVETLMTERHHHVLEAWNERRSVVALLLSRLIPVISFNLINFAAGLSKVSWWTFIWTTGLGILPICIVAVLVGAGIVHFW